MPTLRAEEYEASTVRDVLRKRRLRHLRVRRYGALIIIESGPEADAIPHVRLRRVTKQYWTLEAATHTGRWEGTGLRDCLEPVLEQALRDMAWLFAAVD
jgi:hypothetical protein